MRQALINARVLLDQGFVEDRAVLLDGTRIAGVFAAGDPMLRDASSQIDLAGLTL